MLNRVLFDVVNQLHLLRIQAPDMIVFIDGSYITSKSDPSDIDIVIRSDMLDENLLRQMIWCLPNGRTVDLFVDRYGAPLANTIYDLFTHTLTNQEKGIVQLDI